MSQLLAPDQYVDFCIGYNTDMLIIGVQDASQSIFR